MLAGLALALCFSPQTQTVSLYRGAEIPGSEFRYWGVEDATLDGTQSEAATGGTAFLTGGSGRTILIRFSDLRRVLGPSVKITSAKLRLTVAGADQPAFRSASAVLAPWNEGPTQVVNFANLSATAKAPAGAVTHRWRRAGEKPLNWQAPGAGGPQDARSLDQAQASFADRVVTISGIEEAIQLSYDSPFGIGGVALRFDQQVDFFSSEAARGRPVLELSYQKVDDSGPDLAVTHISRAPWPVKPARSQPQVADQDGLAVPVFPKTDGAAGWPANGTQITYTATIQNLGSAPAGAFSVRWANREEWGSRVELARPLAPGESTTVAYVLPFQNDRADHRYNDIAVEVLPTGPDARPWNNGATAPQVGLGVAFKFEGLSDAERGIQARRATELIDFVNQTVFAMSRFSFAPDGVKERLFFAGLEPNGTEDVVVQLPSPAALMPTKASVQAIMDALEVPNPYRAASVEVQATDSKRILRDLGLSPGLMGGGETRYDGYLPGLIALLPEPIANPILDNTVLSNTDLLGMVEVGDLNRRVGTRGVAGGEVLYELPSLTLFKVTDLQGRPLPNVKLSLYPAIDGKAPNLSGEPTLSAVADKEGAVVFPSRQAGSSNASLKNNPFGRIDHRGRNAHYLVKAEFAGQTEYTWLRLWQIVAAKLRQPNSPAVIEMRVNLSNGPIEATNLAKGKLVTDSQNGLPAVLAAITDENQATGANLPTEANDWVEIDLGRDRIMGEIRLTFAGPEEAWKSFDVFAYATGQTVTEAIQWAAERDTLWRAATQGYTAETGKALIVPYRGAAQRLRYIRLVNRRAAPGAKLLEVQVFGAAINQP
jgi:hypothetical protein